MIYRYGHCNTFWNIMNGNGYGNTDTHGRILQGTYECGESFREVMDSNGHGGEHSHSHELMVLSCSFHLFQILHPFHLVRVFSLWHHLVDESDDKDSQKEDRKSVV